MEIEARAKMLGKDLIEKVDDLTFRVQSQSDPSQHYTIDVEAYHCDCLSFPLVDFCKHICAVQTHFPELPPSIPLSSLAFTKPTPSGNEPDHSDDDESDSGLDDDSDEINDLIGQLQHLAVRTRLAPPSYLTESLRALQTAVKEVLNQTDMVDSEILPQRKKIAPNQHSWTETKAVMGMSVKGAKK